MDSEIDWEFDKTPASGSRRGGDPSKHAFKHDFETFVREVLQNSNDEVVRENDEPVGVTFQFNEVTGSELREFQNSIRWSSLNKHLQTVAATEQGVGVRQFLEKIESQDSMLLLNIEDRNTTGLEGAESGEDSNFTALCKDVLYSHKDENAGGSYGLGKSVLWTFSGISTVLFNSNLRNNPPDEKSPRFIGRSQLPSHKLETSDGEVWYDGSGWLGKLTEHDGNIRAESVWGTEAEELAKSTGMGRGNESGTSILIVGFRDPTSDKNKTAEDFAEELLDAAGKYFWQAMLGGSRLEVGVKTESNTREVTPNQRTSLKPFIECYNRRQTPEEELIDPGDIATREIELNIPDKSDGTETDSGSVTLSVRLSEEDTNEDLQNHVAMFRGSGMVVKYKTKRGLTVGARPFHACLICGEARDPESPSAADSDIEEFLQAAEPPSHNEWISTETLREKYEQGYKKALDELKSDMNDILRELITPTPETGTRGPDKLRKRFPVGHRSGPDNTGGDELPFSFRYPNAVFREGRWEFSALIRPDEENNDGWSVSVTLNTIGEDGSRMGKLPVESVSTDGDIEWKIKDGKAHIEADSAAEEIEISGKSVEVEEGQREVGEVELDVEGEIYLSEED